MTVRCLQQSPRFALPKSLRQRQLSCIQTRVYELLTESIKEKSRGGGEGGGRRGDKTIQYDN